MSIDNSIADKFFNSVRQDPDKALNVDNEIVADLLKQHGGLEFNQLK